MSRVEQPDGQLFRTVLGNFASGVTVVTGGDPRRPTGFTCQSFSSLSLDPPMVVVLPDRRSGSWREIQAHHRFCVNILGRGQEDLSAAFARRGTDKFAGVAWSRSPLGSPVLSDVVAWIDCELVETREGGDHFIALGAVRHCHCTGCDPLVFHRGNYDVLVGRR